MQPKKKVHPAIKSKLHPRNLHRERYDFDKLVDSCPALGTFVSLNKYNDQSINFADPEAVKVLNRALLKHHYQVDYWDIPKNYLCPPIPGRADYIHHIADLLAHTNKGKIPKGRKVQCLDIGVGANCVYPIIGLRSYGWSFIGADVDENAIDSAKTIIENNTNLKGRITIRPQTNSKNTFRGIIQQNEKMDLTLCNPPFHASAEEAQAGTRRKLKNLGNKNISKPNLNFGGKHTELWCEGGEGAFLKTMILQSKEYATSCCWFSSLVSKESNLNGIYKTLKKVGATEIKTLPMGQGNKISRVVAWTFLNKKQQKIWAQTRWSN